MLKIRPLNLSGSKIPQLIITGQKVKGKEVMASSHSIHAWDMGPCILDTLQANKYIVEKVTDGTLELCIHMCGIHMCGIRICGIRICGYMQYVAYVCVVYVCAVYVCAVYIYVYVYVVPKLL